MYKFKSTQLCLKNQIIFTYCFIFQWSLVDQLKYISVQFSSVAQLCLTLCDPMNYSTPGLPTHHQQLESTQIHVHGVGDAINHLILCRLLLLLPSIFLSIMVFSMSQFFVSCGQTIGVSASTSVLPMFSLSISPPNEYSGLISFRMDWLDLLVVEGTPKSLLQHHNLRVPTLWHSAFFMVQLSHL